MMLYQLSVYAKGQESHCVTNSKDVYKAQFVLLKQLLINQMLDRVVTKAVLLEDEEKVESVLFDATRHDVILGDDIF